MENNVKEAIGVEAYSEMIPKDARYIIDTLEAKGYEAYVVGGCVRDMIMNREPNDWDITTSATPDEVKAVFKRTYDTGIQHGTVTVIVDEEHYEVTTYRIEGEYKDSRHPESVSFVDDITLDLSRRDFTMNAIAYHPVRGFVDPYKGRKHIEQQVIKSVREAKARFEEDALRILRAVRFAAQINFAIDPQTIEGIKACKGLLVNISKERIRDEFLKICVSNHPEYIDTLHELELLPYIIPQFIPCYTTSQNNPHHSYNVARHTIIAMQALPQEPMIRLAALLHDIAKPLTRTTDKKGIDHFYNHPEKGADIAKTVLRDLRLDNQTIHQVTHLVRYHDVQINYPLSSVDTKKLLNVLGEELFDALLQLNLADVQAQSSDKWDEKREKIEEMRALKNSIIEKKECYSIKQLDINGKDLIEAGYPKGKMMGEMLEKALDYVLKYPEMNEKSQLKAYLDKEYR